jgi:hypothetical protein
MSRAARREPLQARSGLARFISGDFGSAGTPEINNLLAVAVDPSQNPFITHWRPALPVPATV